MERSSSLPPLVGSLIAGFGWRVIGEKGAQAVTTGLLFLACLLSWGVFTGFDGTTQHLHVLDFIRSGARLIPSGRSGSTG